ncbi:histone acetyltransferase HAC1-like isoform X2 [Tripterygium wilfordii]|uniref:histone acetyltransferase HAC1-like isoform X2 n=1 Tax=Tripterygium wilfordii TaxID=458696 RepID=UPI0018F811A8|nr:histone acetyltransferase HAC1-like isoform X2 [Tripterygium wilfordii]
MSSALNFSGDDIIAAVDARMSSILYNLSLDDSINNSKKSGPGPVRRFPNRGANRGAPYTAAKVEISDLPTDTKDTDEIFERLSMLSLSPGNHYQDGGINHPHKLTNDPSMAERGAQNKEASIAECRSSLCQHPKCSKLKKLNRHWRRCRRTASRGCVLCWKMWYLLHYHARACKDSECNVPRCRDLKNILCTRQVASKERVRKA